MPLQLLSSRRRSRGGPGRRGDCCRRNRRRHRRMRSQSVRRRRLSAGAVSVWVQALLASLQASMVHGLLSSQAGRSAGRQYPRDATLGAVAQHTVVAAEIGDTLGSIGGCTVGRLRAHVGRHLLRYGRPHRSRKRGWRGGSRTKRRASACSRNRRYTRKHIARPCRRRARSGNRWGGCKPRHSRLGAPSGAETTHRDPTQERPSGQSMLTLHSATQAWARQTSDGGQSEL